MNNPTNSPHVPTYADWRAQVDKELAGKSFDKTLVPETIDGILLAPLYVEAPAVSLDRDVRGSPFRICVRHWPGEDVALDVEGGADAVWMKLGELPVESPAGKGTKPFFVLDVAEPDPVAAIERALALEPSSPGVARFALLQDPIGQATAFTALSAALARVAEIARTVDARCPGATSVMVSTLRYHDAGADAVDELAIALATGVRYLEALLDAGLSAEAASRQMVLQVAVGSDTFTELCKLRALRACWQKVVVAAGPVDAPHTLVHAVCSSRTLAVRDPWVNMLRASTQVFSAVLGGADLVTPSAFDQASGAPGALGRRVARNTGLVLREESYLGKVADPAGGSYYLETLSDQLARKGWERFREIERGGGIVAALESGEIAQRIEATWAARLDRVAKRKTPILGVSEFANLDEMLPRPVPSESGSTVAARFPAHRDPETFEALRTRAESLTTRPEALLVTLGAFADSRARVGFASGFLASGGIRTRESTADEKATLACLCGTDERYAEEAIARARSLKAAGCARVIVAGRPGALEPALREAGVDGFIFVGCDVVATLSSLLESFVEVAR
jgi:methylmalonyl-CoA mutase